MAKLLLFPSSIPIHLRFCTASRPFLPIPRPKFSPLRRNLSFKTKTMSVLSESPNEKKKKYSKVAAESTGSIPAAELLGVVELAAKAGAEVIKDDISSFLVAAVAVPMLLLSFVLFLLPLRSPRPPAANIIGRKAVPGGVGSVSYAVIFDAGSYGSQDCQSPGNPNYMKDC